MLVKAYDKIVHQSQDLMTKSEQRVKTGKLRNVAEYNLKPESNTAWINLLLESFWWWATSLMMQKSLKRKSELTHFPAGPLTWSIVFQRGRLFSLDSTSNN